MSSKYITTTIPYVNADPHIGFALEILQADLLARHYRLMGHDVFFNTGVDEHGQKILQKAEEKGEDVQKYVDHYAAEFKKLKEALNLSNDAFVRTTDKNHIEAAQEIWKRCVAKGDIYKKKYKGLYCVGDEAFLKEKDLVDGKCPNHPTMDPIEIEEENYFFRLSNYQGVLLEYLENEKSITPDWRRKEAIDFVQNGLEDFSISREKKRLSWGVPVPGDSEQVMYVWFDALTNYISTLGWPDGEKFKKYWEKGETLQIAGKDQIRFQSIIWQAMLMSADIKTTDSIFYHGFINSGGQKMSKSIGNVISPYELVEKYGTEATRYLLLRHVHPVDDSDITWEKLDEWYTAHLVNGIGNLTARITKLAETHLESPIDRPEAIGFPKEYTDAIESFKFNEAFDYVWSLVGALDKRITDEEPFKVVKTDLEKGRVLITEYMQELYAIGRLLYSILPETNKIIKKTVLENKKPENLFGRI
ncbi:methionine--tRNA ligase [Candidatus Wolfebacteria bacterium]|nr:methionine--tRNA ligase [Candidatus Wolfebacteria bacterium]